MVIQFIVIIFGLMLFEIISSVDNAVINAQVLGSVSARATKWFLTWGLLFAVFAVRGLLPLLVVFFANPALGLEGAFTAALSNDPVAATALEASKPALLSGGGMYLLLLFIQWFLRENDHFAFDLERLARRSHTILFYALVGLVLEIVAFVAAGKINIVYGTAVGATAFFISLIVKGKATTKSQTLVSQNSVGTDISKLVYLELLDCTFSIDGVLGAFAFTTAVPLILLGNGLGAMIVRQITIRGIATVRKLPFLTNGAMYSVAALSIIMLVEAIGKEVPFWLTPLITLFVVGYFTMRSLRPHPSHAKLTS